MAVQLQAVEDLVSKSATNDAREFKATHLESKVKAGARAWRFWRYSIYGACEAGHRAS
jgi:hypothetical protein